MVSYLRTNPYWNDLMTQPTWDPAQDETIDTLVRILKNVRSILFVTGAGVSADSGVPTYRGIGGLYDVGTTDEGLPIEVILSGSMMQSKPELTWKYLAQIGEAAQGAVCNRAHEVIAEMEQHFPRVWTLTQNVDGFHRLAGSTNVIEIHGNMRSLSCTRCAYRTVADPNAQLDIPPLCPECKAIVRPDVVLFEELLPEESVRQLRRQLEQGFDMVFSIGTSSVFPYIQEPMHLARRTGWPSVEINPAETVVSHVADYRLTANAATAMDEIWRRFTA